MWTATCTKHDRHQINYRLVTSSDLGVIVVVLVLTPAVCGQPHVHCWGLLLSRLKRITCLELSSQKDNPIKSSYHVHKLMISNGNSSYD